VRDKIRAGGFFLFAAANLQTAKYQQKEVYKALASHHHRLHHPGDYSIKSSIVAKKQKFSTRKNWRFQSYSVFHVNKEIVIPSVARNLLRNRFPAGVASSLRSSE
jgi:hypothetical protein